MDWKISWSKSESKAGERERERERGAGGGGWWQWVYLVWVGRSATEAINDVIEVLLREKKKNPFEALGKGRKMFKTCEACENFAGWEVQL